MAGKARLKLPSDKRALAEILRSHTSREQERLSMWHTSAILAWYYAIGIRHFTAVNPTTARIEFRLVDTEGSPEFVSQQLLAEVDRVAGFLNGMDFSPKAMRKDNSLQSIRGRAVAQILADAITDESEVANKARDFNWILTYLGSCGISSRVEHMPNLGLNADFEVVHPRELMPFPSLGQDHTKAGGMVRERFVPLSVLKDAFGGRALRRDKLDNMEWWLQRIGDIVSRFEGDNDIAVDSVSRSQTGMRPKDIDPQDAAIVKIRELWLDGPSGTCSRYVVSSGEEVIADESFEFVRAYCPIGFERLIDNGTFHGMGLFHLLFSQVRELERMMKTLSKNVRDMDRYGVTVIPQGAFNERSHQRDVGRDLRILTYEPDTMGGDFRPFQIQPQTTGDFPGRVAQFFREAATGLSPLRQLSEEKGRIDSAMGLQLLDERLQQSMANPVSASIRAWSSMYRAMVNQAVEKVVTTPDPLPVSRLTLDLAGAVIDPETNSVNFRDNPLPNLDKLNFSINREPRSNVARKQEALGLVESGISTPQDLIWIALTEGLDFAMPWRRFEGAFESVVRDILIVYGDGETPGKVVVTPATVAPEFQLMVVEDFLQRPIVRQASPAVVNALQDYRETLMEFSNMVLPEGIPGTPDEMAMMAQQLEQQFAQTQQAQTQEAQV